MNLADLYIAKKLAGGGGGGTGTDNYNDLSNKPQINGTTLTGDKSAADLELQPTIDSENPISADYVDDSASTNKFVTSSDKLTWGGKQDKIDADHKLSSDLVDDTGHTNLFVTPTEKSTWSGKQNAIDSSHKLSSDLVDDTNHTNKFVTSAEKNTWNAKQNAIDSDHKLSSSLVSFSTAEAAALASGIDSDDVNQIGVNQTNILYTLQANGRKNLIKNFDRIESGGCVFTYSANGQITVTGTKTVQLAIADLIVNEDLSKYGLSAGDQVVLVSDNANIATVVIFGDSQGSYDTAISAYNETKIVTIPSGRTKWYVRIQVKSAITGTINETINPMVCDKRLYDIDPTVTPYAAPNYDLTRMVNDLQKKAVKVYTYHVNPNESDPEDAVTYLDDASGLTPAKMGASSFSYGSWANAWFLPRPCMLKSDGTVAYYLNPNDYGKKTDGTASDIADLTFDGNVMLEFPKIWVKRVAGSASGERTVSIAPVNVDGTYKCWSNINAEDKEVDHFYLPAYNGTIDNNAKMRSMSDVTLSGTAPQTSPYAYAPNYTRAQEVTAATANNPTGKNLWYTETWADFCLIYDLLYLMGKSLDVQRTFGQGLSSGSETAMRAYITGTHNAKGLFYGDISGTSTAVKVLGMENLWGCRWHGVAGLINDNGTLKVKMTYGVADGSTTVGYNTTGSGYLNYGSTYGTNGYVKKMQADNTMGYKIIETAGTDATYYCDYYYTNNSQSNYALFGGRSDGGARCGFYVGLDRGAAHTGWSVGGSLSCRP